MNSELEQKIHLILSALSTKPGVYRFRDENGKVIYVGKAKNLKRRVSSYFNKNHDSPKVRMLVTNFHQPKSTLLLLVSAFVRGDWRRIYDYALGHDFRFLSYGDSSLLIP